MISETKADFEISELKTDTSTAKEIETGEFTL